MQIELNNTFQKHFSPETLGEEKPSTKFVKSFSGYTASRHFHRSFCDGVANEVIVALEPFKNWGLILNVYTPPWESTAPHGVLNLCFFNGEEEKIIGIVFGAEAEEEGEDYRQPFDAVGWQCDSDNPFASGIFTASWDECWYIMCKIVASVKPATVEFSFGA